MVMQERDREARPDDAPPQRAASSSSRPRRSSRACPAVLHPLPEGAPRDRLALARWLVAPENPLVGRVAMNQAWQAFFGRGLVATVEDFGTRGDEPTHPELLDWLATRVPPPGLEHEGDAPTDRHESATYRQSSADPARAARPATRRTSCWPAGRGSASRPRSSATSPWPPPACSTRKVGGPSVYPPQPEGVTALAYSQCGWPTSDGPDRYRRGLYTFTQAAPPPTPRSPRSTPPAPRLACVRRERSNTPLQALTLLNDPASVEAARALARRTLARADDDRSSPPLRLPLLPDPRAPRPEESTPCAAFLDQQLARFRAGEADAAKVAGLRPQGERRREPENGRVDDARAGVPEPRRDDHQGMNGRSPADGRRSE